MQRLLTVLAVVLLAGALVSGSSEAASLRHLSIERLAAASEACVLARVVDSTVGWSDSGRVIVTTYTLEQEEVLAGEPPPGPLTLTRVGGELDGLALTHDGMPELTVGETAALFLRERAHGHYVISGLRQGVFRRHGDELVRDLRGINGAPSRFERLSLDDLRSRVRAAGLDRPALNREPNGERR
ncbi:MAG: hypothetical protein AAF533_05785 [Acidobacteriota bacterium]